eukprot:8819148-Pyramimonas_sp.AAC.1
MRALLLQSHFFGLRLIRVRRQVCSSFIKKVRCVKGVGRLTLALQDAQHLGAGNGAHLGDAVVITENHTNLGRGETLLGELAALLLNLFE